MNVLEAYVTCPFDKAHRILNTRLQQHLVKCRRNHPKVSYVICPFSAIHILHPEEYEHHLSTCTSGNVECYQPSLEENTEVGTISLEQACNLQTTSTVEEDWCGNNPTYDPIAEIAKKPVMQVPIGLSKAKKKQFKKQERERLAKLENQMGNNNNIVKSDTPKKSEFKEPLRIPKHAAKAVSYDNTEDISDNITSLTIKLENTSLATAEHSFANENVSSLKNNTSVNMFDGKDTSKNTSKAEIHVSMASANISECKEKENILNENTSTTQKSNSETSPVDKAFEMNTNTPRKEKSPISQSYDDKKEEQCRRVLRANTKLIPRLYGETKKISTGRGFNIAYEKFTTQLLGKKDTNKATEDVASVYGYDED